MLNRWHYVPLVLVSSYVLFVALVLHPQIQAHNVFLHSINFPFHFDLSKPDRVKSLSGKRVRNFKVRTADGVAISGWHLLPDDLQSHGDELENGAAFDLSLRQYPTIIYFHGNAMNRAAPFRIQAYKQFTAIGLNVVAIDYRGFGDSEGSPSEEGLQRDARATYRWIRERLGEEQHRSEAASSAPPPIYIAGQSLGTGVATRLALDLVRVGHPPEALFLLAPYTSIGKLLSTYKIAGVLPIFWPLGVWKTLSDLADRHLYTRFESDKAIYQIVKGAGRVCTGDDQLSVEERREYGNLDHTLSEAILLEELGLSADKREADAATHIIISHADDDGVIPHTHGRSLFDTIAKALGRSETTERKCDWGTAISLDSSQGGGRDQYILIKSRMGGHNGVPQHAVQLLAETVGLMQSKKRQ